MKRRIMVFTVTIYLTVCTSITAQVKINAETPENSRTHIDVVMAGETAVIIDGKKYSLPEMIKTAIELNPDIYISKYNVAMSDTYSMKFNAKFSPLLNASAGKSSVEYPDTLYSKYWKKNESVDAKVSLGKYFSTGTTVAAGIGSTKSDMDTGFGPTLNINSPFVFATLEQELLKNTFGYNDRKQIKMLDNVTIMQRDAYLYSISMIAFSVILDYWDVVLAQNRLNNANLMYSETLKVRRIVSEKVRIGLSESFEINYWNSMVASSKASVKQAEQNYRNASRKLLRNLNIDRQITMQEKVILTDSFPEINMEESLKRAFEKRADYLNAARELENAKLSFDINRNMALPSLKGSVTVSSMDYNIDSSGDAYSNTKNMKYPSYDARIAMTYPLNDTSQKADERNAEWIIEQSKQNLEKTRRSVRDDVVTKIENINTNYQLYTEGKETSRQAKLYYEKMVNNLRTGRFAASSVRDALDALVSSREMELTLLVAYNASLIEFAIAKNELFDTYGINIDKYIPGEK